jgi:hypothetical protein
LSGYVTRISAIGTRGHARDMVFIAKRNSAGRYVLHRKTPSHASNATNTVPNKVYVDSLDDAARLLETDDYVMNVVASDGQRALRELKNITIQRC